MIWICMALDISHYIQYIVVNDIKLWVVVDRLDDFKSLYCFTTYADSDKYRSTDIFI